MRTNPMAQHSDKANEERAPTALEQLQAEMLTEDELNDCLEWNYDDIYDAESVAALNALIARKLAPHIAAVESLTRERDALRAAGDVLIYVGSRLNSLAESLTIEHRVSSCDYDASNVMASDWKEAKAAWAALREAAGS